MSVALPGFLVPRTKAYRPEIDGLRAFSVIAVLINHLDPAWLPGGFLGVDIFFVISGYVVTSSLLVRQEISRWSFLGQFYGRRFRRLLPALIVNVTITAIIFAMVVPPMEDLHAATLRTGLSALFGVSNLYLLRQGSNYFSADNHYNVFLQTWSLGVEEQFYLVWPALLLLCGLGVSGASRCSLRWLKLACLVLLSASLALFVLLHLRGQSERAFYLTPARFWELTAGSLAYQLHRGSGTARDLGSRLPLEKVRGPLSLVMLVALASLLFLPERWSLVSTISISILSAALLVLAQPVSLAGRLLCHPLAVSIGLISYSLYLWHWPVIVLFRWTVGVDLRTIPMILLVIALLTLLSYQLETRLRFAKQGGYSIILYPLTAVLAAGWLFLLQGPLRAFPFLGDRSSLQEGTLNMKRIDGTGVSTANCFLDPTTPIRPSVTRDACHAVNVTDRPTLFFEGDSHTHVLIPLGGEILKGGRWNVAFHARGGCPFPYFEPRSGNSHTIERYRLCRPHYEDALEHIQARLKPGDQLVLVSSLYGHFSSLAAAERKAAETSYGDGIKRIAAAARRKGAGVILFGPLPSFDQKKISVPLSLCSPQWFRPLWAINQACQPVARDRNEVISENERVLGLLDNLAAEVKDVSLFDPFESLCPVGQTTCSTHRGGEALFSDGNHLTNAGAIELYPRLQRFLGRLDPSSGL
ncbi:MAG: acyltransferase family protein [Cyanobacteriota bacterium]